MKKWARAKYQLKSTVRGEADESDGITGASGFGKGGRPGGNGSPEK